MCENRVIERASYAKINEEYKQFCKNPKARLPLIRLYYGPHEHNGFIKHKPQKLFGLAACLEKLHFDVEKIPSTHLNVLKIVILGHDAYQRNIKYLSFNIDCNFDEICQSVLEQVEEATYRLYSDSNVSKDIYQWIDDQMEDLSASYTDSFESSSLYTF